MSIKIREAEGEMPFWVEEAIRDEGLQQETEPGAPISQGETEEGRKKKTSQCEEGNSSTRKGETTKKKRKQKRFASNSTSQMAHRNLRPLTALELYKKRLT